MEYLEFIKPNTRVYHITYGWGVVTSGECGTDFQVKFPNIKQVQSFKANGFDYESITRVIYEDEVKILGLKDKDTLFGLEAIVLKDGNINLSFNGVNNPEILLIIEALMDAVIDKELSKGNTQKELNALVDVLSSNIKHSIQVKSNS